MKPMSNRRHNIVKRLVVVLRLGRRLRTQKKSCHLIAALLCKRLRFAHALICSLQVNYGQLSSSRWQTIQLAPKYTRPLEDVYSSDHPTLICSVNTCTSGADYNSEQTSQPFLSIVY